MVNRVWREDHLKKPIEVEGEYPIVQYDDDTIIILPADEIQLLHFKEILNQYASFTGLKVNLHKYSLQPINLSNCDAPESGTMQISAFPPKST